ncbi:hypothetical protein ACL02S_23845 [Nocardia sp. 004]|uniref:hypothetical protein n=1 Tax=Nocardia sp. 004 TaxID=3385978 RepID=UPI00399F427F
MAEEYTPVGVEEILGRISELSGLHLVCVWDSYDGYEFSGNPRFYIEADGWFYNLDGDLREWLHRATTDPTTPGHPRNWIGPLSTDITTNDIAYTDNHNHAREIR